MAKISLRAHNIDPFVRAVGSPLRWRSMRLRRGDDRRTDMALQAHLYPRGRIVHILGRGYKEMLDARTAGFYSVQNASWRRLRARSLPIGEMQNLNWSRSCFHD